MHEFLRGLGSRKLIVLSPIPPLDLARVTLAIMQLDLVVINSVT